MFGPSPAGSDEPVKVLEHSVMGSLHYVGKSRDLSLTGMGQDRKQMVQVGE
jgi:hypothetical protein